MKPQYCGHLMAISHILKFTCFNLTYFVSIYCEFYLGTRFVEKIATLNFHEVRGYRLGPNTSGRKKWYFRSGYSAETTFFDISAWPLLKVALNFVVSGCTVSPEVLVANERNKGCHYNWDKIGYVAFSEDMKNFGICSPRNYFLLVNIVQENTKEDKK